MNNPDIEHIEALLLKKLEGKITDEEQRELDLWSDQNPLNPQLLEHLDDPAWMAAQMEIFDSIPVRMPAGTRKGIVRMPRWLKIAAAALLIVSGSFLIKMLDRTPKEIAYTNQPSDVPPGREGAMLTLSDGTVVSLDSLKQGLIAKQQGSDIVVSNGKLGYLQNHQSGRELKYNVVATPRGRRFNFQLPDGSLVWLNAASSIRFPVNFDSNNRKVEVTGEVYFEVVSSPSQPFIVALNDGGFLKVLGTSFNVKAYPEEKEVSTTLISGKLAVENRTGKNVFLSPGQQANMSPDNIKLSKNVQVDAAIAWKNNLFNFSDKKLEEVMREIARWYDLEVVYEHGVPDITFGGEMSRNESLSDVLLGLQDANVKFKLVSGRKLIVLP
ncbi:FecR family protein [Chitinophaga sp.]|uniref:FecR family protein n=1 Tax=Chitinophaga sp. TaxID=1869181 RepID=UPI002CBC6A6A|nr:FecR domain-containing protein [Chitinophaga sp.]HWV66330.1 FecR domain-containing protein [Chitinophaga sp.]